MTDLAGSRELFDLSAWDALEPIETSRMELVDGVVIVSPRPQAPHVVVTSTLIVRLAEIGLLALPEPELVLAAKRPATVRVPDLVVLREGTAIPTGGRFDVADVLLAIEIVSPGSRRTDYVAKRYDYAQAGIGYYWIVDPAERRLSCLQLTDGEYQELPVVEGEDSVTVTAPVRCLLSWSGLLRS